MLGVDGCVETPPERKTGVGSACLSDDHLSSTVAADTTRSLVGRQQVQSRIPNIVSREVGVTICCAAIPAVARRPGETIRLSLGDASPAPCISDCRWAKKVGPRCLLGLPVAVESTVKTMSCLDSVCKARGMNCRRRIQDRFRRAVQHRGTHTRRQ